MAYEVAFDISSKGYSNWPFVTPGLIFVILGLIMLRSHKYLPMRPLKLSDKAKQNYAILFVAGATIWTIGAFSATYLNTDD